MIDGAHPAHRPLNLALVGLGRWGVNIARTVTQIPGARLALLCDSDPFKLAGSALDCLPGARRSRYHEVIADECIDAVLLATPPESHARLTMEALAARKHVFVEKPLALTLRDARRVCDASIRSRRSVVVGHVMRYHPAVVELGRMARSGVLGDIRAIFAERLGASSSHHPEGPWWALAPHDISTANHLFVADPTDVCAVTRTVTSPLARSVETVARLSYPGGGFLRIRCQSGSKEKRRRTVVLGSEAFAVLDELDQTSPLKAFALEAEAPSSGELQRFAHAMPVGSFAFACPLAGIDQLERAAQKAPAFVPALPQTPPLFAELAAFVEAVRGGPSPITDVAEGCSVVAALEAGFQSTRANGSAVQVAGARRIRPHSSPSAHAAPRATRPAQ